MTAAVDVGEGALNADESVVFAGERNLLQSDDLASNMERLRRLFDLFEQKTSLLHLLDAVAARRRACRSTSAASRAWCRSTRCSVVTAPYEVDGQVIGTLGVIGPTRMAYERVIPIVDVTAKLLSNALTRSSPMPEPARTPGSRRQRRMIGRFYAALGRRDAATMVACYAARRRILGPGVPATSTRAGVAAMWRMLCARGKDLAVDASAIAADDATGRAHWVATYTYSATGRRVDNRIDARFAFRDGLILRHEDRFDLRRWTRQALGSKGVLLGWLPAARRDVQAQAARALDAWRAQRTPAGLRQPADRAGAGRPPAPLLSPIHRQANRTAHELPARTPVRPRPRAARRRAAGQPRHARRADAGGRAPLSRASSCPIRAWSRSRVAIWLPILHGVILRVRPAQVGAPSTRRSGPRTARRCSCTARKQASLLQGYLGQRLKAAGLPPDFAAVELAMRYGNPDVAGAIDRLRAAGCDRILVVPLYPQYAASTTASALDAVYAHVARTRRMPALRFVDCFHDDPGYIKALARGGQRLLDDATGGRTSWC